MHGNDGFRLEQIAGVRGLAWSHGEMIADGQHGDFRSVKFADDGHVSENIRVAGVVDLDSILELDHIATSFAAVNELFAVLNAAGMVGVDHGDFDVADLLRTTLVHHGDVPGALLLQPSAQFRDANNLGIVLLDDLDGVSDVIPVAVGAQKNIDLLHFFLGGRAHRVVHDPGIDNDGLPARSYDAKRRVAEPRKLNAFEIHEL